MRSILVSVSFLLAALAPCAFAVATPVPVHSLYDLPSRFEGQAGDFATRVNAVFTIAKVTKVTHGENSEKGYTTYDVDASMVLGERSIAITQIILRPYAELPTATEFYIRTSDELVPALQAAVFYDEATNSFTLKDFIHQGERHFVLHASAKSYLGH